MKGILYFPCSFQFVRYKT